MAEAKTRPTEQSVGSYLEAIDDEAQRSEGCAVDDKVEESEFGWVMDPEGNRIELWQPPKGS